MPLADAGGGGGEMKELKKVQISFTKAQAVHRINSGEAEVDE